MKSFLTISFCSPSRVNAIPLNIQVTLIFTISSIFTVPYNRLSASLVSEQSTYLFLSSICIRVLVFISLNILIITDLIFHSTSSLILSNTKITGVSPYTSIKGSNFPPLRSLFITCNVPLYCLKCTICVILLSFVLL